MDPPKGYRFHPEDWELINYYLRLMVLGLVSEVDDEIAEIDILEHEPWHLPAFAAIQSDGPYWYFFYKLRKYKNGNRAARKTHNGYWKITADDQEVRCSESGEVIGIKKTLTFYNGHPKGVITNWIKHEYHATAADFPDNRNNYVVCRLRRKPDDKADNSSPYKGESSRHVAPNYGNNSGGKTTTEDNPFSLQNLVNNGWASPSNFQYQMPMQQSYTNEGDQDFWDSVIVDPQDEDEHIYRNRSSTPKSLQMVCIDSGNGLEIETFPVQYEQVLGPPSLPNGRSSTKPYRQMQIVQGFERVQPFSTRDCSFHSSTNKDYKIDPKFCDEKHYIQKSQYQTKSHNPSSAKADGGGQVDFSRKAAIDNKLQVGEIINFGTAVDQLKHNSKMGPVKDTKISLKTETKVTMKSHSHWTVGSDHKEFSALLKTSESSHNSKMPLVYLFNAILGIFLLFIVLLELIQYEDWY